MTSLQPRAIPSSDLRRETKRRRVEYNFTAKRGEDALIRLMQLANECKHVQVIADEFGVSRQRMSQVLKVLLGKSYNVWLAEHGVRRKKVTPPEETS